MRAGLSFGRKALDKMNLEFVKHGAWAQLEQQLAARFGLQLYPAEGQLMVLLVKKVKQSAFTPEEILAEFQQDPETIAEFGRRWYADCLGHEYGEEWNPEEGNQQEDSSTLAEEGITQGFMLSYTLLYLYAKRMPESLLDFIKRSRIPQARKVARNVMRVFAATGEGCP